MNNVIQGHFDMSLSLRSRFLDLSCEWNGRQRTSLRAKRGKLKNTSYNHISPTPSGGWEALSLRGIAVQSAVFDRISQTEHHIIPTSKPH